MKDLIHDNCQRTTNSSGGRTPRERAARFQFMRLADLRKRAPTKWLISGIVAEGLLSVYYGPYGCGKSFGALDMCLCLDTGRAWHGHKVQPVLGRVIYVAAEGVSGILQRIEAWKIENHLEVDPDLLILGEAPQLTSSADTLALKDAIHQEFGPDIQPALIVIDTLCLTSISFAGALPRLKSYCERPVASPIMSPNVLAHANRGGRNHGEVIHEFSGQARTPRPSRQSLS